MKPTTRQDCPIARVALLLSDPWTMLILRDLARKPMRFSELSRIARTVSTRTLALKLKRLEKLGMIKKKGVLYAMTPAGAKVKPIMEEMSKYGKRYL